MDDQTNAAEPQAPVRPVLDAAGLGALGSMLVGKFRQYEADRKLCELKWTRNARQYLGIYDPEIDSQMDPNRSKAYPKMTRVKCVSMLSRLMNLLFQESDKCWSVEPSKVPDLSQEDLQTVLDKVSPPQGQTAQQAGAVGAPPAPPDDAAIEEAIRDFAKQRALKLELEIEDQLEELGGSRTIDFVALCRKVIASGVQYGMGIIKGPFIEEQKSRTWKQDTNGRLMAVEGTARMPRFEFVPIWDYYPDMSAKYLHQMEGQFQRIVMSKHQVVMLKQRPDFFADQIDKFLKNSQQGNYQRRQFETELRNMGVQNNVAQSQRNKYEAIVWDGNITGAELKAIGLDIPDDKLNEDLLATVWLMDNIVIKAELNPWSVLETDGEMPMYHHFTFEEDESSILGTGLPNIMRDSQMGMCAAVRMLLDNSSIQRVFEINTTLLRLNQDTTTISHDKIFYREDIDLQTAAIPAIRAIKLDANLESMQGLINVFREFADQETFVSPATGGDMQKGPSEPFRTATGASMIRGEAALPFKDVVRNFDVFIESVIGALIVFNRNFNEDVSLQGDFQPVARGATSLIAKEVLGVQLDNLANTLTPEEKKYMNMRELARARVRVRDMVPGDLVMTDSQCDAVDQAAQQAQQAQQAQLVKLQEAQVRELLAKALKEISAAGKNNAQAEAETANTLLRAMEIGLDPNNVTPPNGSRSKETGGGAASGDSSRSAGSSDSGTGQDVIPAAGTATSQAAAMPAG